MNIDRIAAQYRRPSGIRGFFISRKMEEKNAPVYAWLLPHLALPPAAKVLEIGFGTGWGLHMLALENPSLKLFGIDFSRMMLRQARVKNRKFIKRGRINLAWGDILDYREAGDFDNIFCVNVVYFWEGLERYFSKLSGLLIPGGKLHVYIASERRLDKVVHTHSAIFNKYSLDFVKAELSRARFEDVTSCTNDTELGPAYLISACKPAAAALGDGAR